MRDFDGLCPELQVLCLLQSCSTDFSSNRTFLHFYKNILKEFQSIF